MERNALDGGQIMHLLDGWDSELEEMWAELEDVPMDPVTEEIEADFYHFPKGTTREEIWHWFDEHHSMGVNYLLYGPLSVLYSHLKSSREKRDEDAV